MWEEEEEEKRDKRDSHRGGGRERKGAFFLRLSVGGPSSRYWCAKRRRGGEAERKDLQSKWWVEKEKKALVAGYIYPRRLQSLFIVRCDSKQGDDTNAKYYTQPKSSFLPVSIP